MAQVQVGLLVFIRITSFMILSPIFSHRSVPSLAKVVLSASLMLPAISYATTYEPTESLFILALLALKEVLFGLAMGYVSQLIFVGVEMAGQLIDFQVGFSMGQAYDPAFQIMSSQYGKIYYWLALAVVYLSNLHHLLIRGIVTSFSIVPLGAVDISGITVEGIVKLFAYTFQMALQLAAPLVVAALVIDVVLGVLSRSIPQINVLMLGMPIKTGISFIMFLALIPNAVSYLGKITPQAIEMFNQFIQSLK